MENKVVGFIGAGNMAFAIAKGIISSGFLSPKNIIASARTRVRLDTIWKELGVATTTDNIEVINQADIIILAVKPFVLSSILDQIKGVGGLTSKLFISIATGVTLETIQTRLLGCKVIRTMPNTPCLVQCGVVLYVCGSLCSKEDSDFVKLFFKCTGIVEEVDENHIDAMTSIMGCSIAWYYMVVEAMSDGGVMNGVPRGAAYMLAAKSMEGAARMLLETGKHPGELKDAVTSAGGSTIRGVNELEASGIRGAFMRAVTSATQRNIELSRLK
ncbi:uncharacterized protein LOC100205698 [Hydra vulgaris]|uniref:Pyrroline-5-carboxylate reductase n=1 Tax=Hydra vulgaris TaxID=6087 RepID=A0ABM4BIZ6_HYDVU